MNPYLNLFISLLIVILALFVLVVIRRLYINSLSRSSEHLFFEDLGGFGDKYHHNPKSAAFYLLKKTTDIINRFSFYRSLILIGWITFALFIAIPIEWITDYFQVALNTSFGFFVIYFGYLIWRFSVTIKQLKNIQSSISSKLQRDFLNN